MRTKWRSIVTSDCIEQISVPKGRKGRASGATASGGRDQGAAILAVKWAAKIAEKN